MQTRCKHGHTDKTHPKCFENVNAAPDADEESMIYFADKGETAEASAALDMDTIKSDKEVIKAMGIDESIWYIYQKQIGKQVAWRKDRSVIWRVRDGKVIQGDVEDSGKIKTVPLFNVKVWLRRKSESIKAELALEDFKKEVHKFTPQSAPLVFQKKKGGFLYEIEMPDMHIGKLTWGEESGEDSNLTSQVELAKKISAELLSYTEKFPIEKIS